MDKGNSKTTGKNEMPKLRLKKETIRRLTVLSSDQLKQVVGGKGDDMPSYCIAC
jgi:hypothetical protein